MRKLLLVLVAGVIFATGCRTEGQAREDLNNACADHGGVKALPDKLAGALCKDGTVVDY